MNRSRILVLPLLLTLVALPVVALFSLTGGSVSPASAADQTDRTVLTWHGKQQHVYLPFDSQMIPGAPSSFRQFARAQFRQTWTTYLHHKPACKSAPDFYVRELSTDGFAIGAAGTHPVPGCQTGGGYEAFWAIRKGEWKEVIGTQDVPKCQRLQKLDFPADLETIQCVSGTDVITYTNP